MDTIHKLSQLILEQTMGSIFGGYKILGWTKKVGGKLNQGRGKLKIENLRWL